MILDVGCGLSRSGDVNVDLNFSYPYVTEHGRIAKIEPDIRADAHYLPFKENCFKTVIAKELLEHLQNPRKVLLEFARVSRHIILTVPIELVFYIIEFFFYRKWHTKSEHLHLNSFNKKNLSKLLISCNFKKFNISLRWSYISTFKHKIVKIPRGYRVEIFK